MIFSEQINRLKIHLSLYKKYRKHKRTRSGMSRKNYITEYRKYLSHLNINFDLANLNQQIDEFFLHEIECLKNDTEFSWDSYSPVVISVVKNEKARMHLFYEHYRKLGVKQFAILDNDSIDGTLEFLINQPDTHVYSVKENFQTNKKTAWIEKLLALEGYNRWYIVVDSDELLDYPRSETQKIESFIKCIDNSGYKRALGMMLDMYSKQEVFSVECEALNIPNKLSYFDCESYIMYKKSNGDKSNYITGGPRYRIWNMEMWLNKQSVFYFSPEMLYRNCHFLCPQIGWEDAPFCFVLRHYKFLKSDKSEYNRRIEEKTFFNNSSQYVQLMTEYNKGKQCMLYEKSVHYENSYSLLKIPYITDIFEDSSFKNK